MPNRRGFEKKKKIVKVKKVKKNNVKIKYIQVLRATLTVSFFLNGV